MQTVLDLAEFAKEQDFSFIEIFTNGTLLSAEAVKRIKDLEVSIALSIYSSYTYVRAYHMLAICWSPKTALATQTATEAELR